MPIKWFTCPDGERIEIQDCFKTRGCRMGERCATMPYLRAAGYERPWKGITPSAAGNGPKMMFLKNTKPYAVDPQQRAWALFGVYVHEKLAIDRYSDNCLTEEPLTTEQMAGIPDVLSEDEDKPGYFILDDTKTGGSFKAGKVLGIRKVDVEVLGPDGKPVRYKSGPRKGKIKTRKETRYDGEPDKLEYTLQLNAYRMLFEAHGFPISKMRLQWIPRDGGIKIAKSRGVAQNIFMVPIERMDDGDVDGFYSDLRLDYEGCTQGICRDCTPWETWGGDRCAKGFCDVKEYCEQGGGNG